MQDQQKVCPLLQDAVSEAGCLDPREVTELKEA